MRMRSRLVRLAIAFVVLLVVSSCSLSAKSTDVAHDWALTSVNGNTLEVVVAVGSGSCDRFKGIEVSETSTEVNITAVVAEKQAGSGLFAAPCTSDLGFENIEVVLEQPLGERTLTGCGPGDAGLEKYFADRRTSDSCAEIVNVG